MLVVNIKIDLANPVIEVLDKVMNSLRGDLNLAIDWMGVFTQRKTLDPSADIALCEDDALLRKINCVEQGGAHISEYIVGPE